MQEVWSHEPNQESSQMPQERQGWKEMTATERARAISMTLIAGSVVLQFIGVGVRIASGQWEPSTFLKKISDFKLPEGYSMRTKVEPDGTTTVKISPESAAAKAGERQRYVIEIPGEKTRVEYELFAPKMKSVPNKRQSVSPKAPDAKSILDANDRGRS